MNQSPVETKIAQMCLRLIESAKKSRKRFLESGREIMRYGYSPDYKFEYQTINPKAWMKMKVAKTAEAMQIIVPRLSPGQVVNRLLTARDQDPAVMARTDARSAYLNYTPKHTRHVRNRRRCTEEAVGYGRGVMWTGRDPKTGLVCSKWDSVRNLFVDSDAIMQEDIHCSHRQRLLPRYELTAEYPEATELIMELPPAAKRTSDADSSYEWEKSDTTTDCVRVFECYFEKGIHNYQGGIEIIKAMSQGNGTPITDKQAKQQAYTADDTPMMYLVSESGKLLAQVEWNVPFHLLPSNPWPWTALDLYDNPDSAWPISMLEPGLGFQRAMNHLATLMMGKARYTLKTVMAIKKQNKNGISKGDVQKVLQGADIEAIEVEFNGDNQKLSDYIEQFDWNMDWVGSTITLLDVFGKMFERATGMYDFLSSGEGSTQDRSAAATQVRDRNTMVRIEDMRDTNKEFDTVLAQKEAFAASYLLKKKDVVTVIPVQGQNWGFLARDQAKSMDYWITYAQQELGMMDQMQQVQYAQQMMAQAYTLDEIIWQTDFEIEAGSTRRKDIDQQLELIGVQKNTVMPLQLGSMDPNEKAMAYDLLAVEGKLSGLPEELINGYKKMAADLRAMAAMMLQGPPPVAGEAPPGAPGAPPPAEPPAPAPSAPPEKGVQRDEQGNVSQVNGKKSYRVVRDDSGLISGIETQ